MNSLSLFNEIYNIENLFCAWRKVKHVYESDSDFIFQIEELSEFEADLDNNLKKLSEEIKNDNYRIGRMIPLWLPKVSDEPESRQNFYFSVRDQVAWTAVINIIGPLLDNEMPYWSFGNRLYMPIWKECISKGDTVGKEKKITKYGYYSSASPKIYRNWSSSWPLFRKAVSICVKTMAFVNKEEYSDEEIEDRESNANAPDSLKIKYWNKSYWKKEDGCDDVYYASIDLKRFYPNLKKDDVLNSEVERILRITGESDKLRILMKRLLDFQVDINYINFLNKDNPTYGINLKTGKFNGIPTGLFVAGFLANIAMLPIDKSVNSQLEQRRKIGHFRFVDDHVFLSYSFEELCEWIEAYRGILKSQNNKLKVNEDKIEPEELKHYLSSVSKKRVKNNADAKNSCKLDPQLPVPFTTLTLRKLSGMNSSPFDLLDEDGKKKLLNDIEHILSTDFPNDEIRKDTRVSWASSMMIKLVPLLDIDIYDLYKMRKKIQLSEMQLMNLNAENDEQRYRELSETIKKNRDEYIEYKRQGEKNLNRIYKHIFSLITKALIDNMAKPKLWKKCVDFCRITGFNGISILLELLNENQTLTPDGKNYIFATIISSAIKNILISINISSSDYFTYREKSNAEKFVNEAQSLLKEKNNLWKELFFAKYDNCLLQQLSWTFELYEIECKAKKSVEKVYCNEFICFLWWYMPIYIRHTSDAEPPNIINFMLENEEIQGESAVYKKILLMFPQKLNESQRILLTENKLSPVRCDNIDEDGSSLISLQTIFTEKGTSNDEKGFDILRSEWTVLNVVRKIIGKIERSRPQVLEFVKSNKDSDFCNCAPCNFYISHDIKKCVNWNKIKTFLSENDIIFKNVCEDYRYDSAFYNNAGTIAEEKRQVYSCAVLLLTLLSKSADFPPSVGRSSLLERNYKQLLAKIIGLPISSYTQAILIGAMSDKWFEYRNYTHFDVMRDGRTEEAIDAVVKIETLSSFSEELDGAIRTLERYQLSLQEREMRQLIPISLKNLTKDYNPYNNSGETNE